MIGILDRIDREDCIDNFDTRFEDIDLDSLTMEELQNLLTDEELNAFSKILENDEALQAIISTWTPWWDPNQLTWNIPEIIKLERSPGFKNPGIIYHIIDFVASYVVTARTQNGILLEHPEDTLVLLFEISYVLSLGDTQFVYDSSIDCMQIMKSRILEHPLNLEENALATYFKDIAAILSNFDYVLASLSDIRNICSAISKKHKQFYKNAIKCARKMEFFISKMDPMFLEPLILELATVENDWTPSRWKASRPMIEEI